ncbi:MAG: hypothetical protein AB8G11_14320 [Saprospiraceae bacterium]
MKHLNEAKEGLIELMFKGLDHGISSIQDSEGLLIVFSLFQQNGEIKIVRFVTDKLEDGPIQAQKYLVKMDEKPDFAVIAYEGIVTIENEKFDAVIVEGFDKNDTDAYVLAQRFKRKTAKSKFEAIGNAGYFGNCENVLK